MNPLITNNLSPKMMDNPTPAPIRWTEVQFSPDLTANTTSVPSWNTSPQCLYRNRGRQCRNRTRNPPYCHIHRVSEPRPTDERKEETRGKRKEVDDCPICLETKRIRILNCTHVVCSECIGKLRDYSCPICRRYIAADLSKEEMDGIIKRKVRDGIDTVRNEEMNLRAIEIRDAYLRDLERLQARHRIEVTSIRKEYEGLITAVLNGK